jgi:hypothetical protein
MDYRVKSYVMLSIIFVMGFLAGMIVKDLLTESPLEQIRNIRTRGVFIGGLENDLELTEKQKKEVRPILDKYDKQIQVFVESGREFFNISLDSLKAELKPYLNKEQIKKMDENFPRPVPGMVINFHPEKLLNRLGESLQLSDKQKKEIMPVLEDYSKNVHLQRPIKIRHYNSPFDSLKEKLKPYLTKEQIKKLDEEFIPAFPEGEGFGIGAGIEPGEGGIITGHE